jgi:hypothetical protein
VVSTVVTKLECITPSTLIKLKVVQSSTTLLLLIDRSYVGIKFEFGISIPSGHLKDTPSINQSFVRTSVPPSSN